MQSIVRSVQKNVWWSSGLAPAFVSYGLASSAVKPQMSNVQRIRNRMYYFFRQVKDIFTTN
jgi:hypothetical protein